MILRSNIQSLFNSAALFWSRIQSGSLVVFGHHVCLASFNLEQRLMSFPTLTSWKSASPLFYRTPLTVRLLDWVLEIGVRFCVFGSSRACALCPSCPQYLTLGGTGVTDSWGRVLSARCPLFQELTPSIISRYSVRRWFETLWIAPSPTATQEFRIHWKLASESVIIMEVAGLWFFFF